MASSSTGAPCWPSDPGELRPISSETSSSASSAPLSPFSGVPAGESVAGIAAKPSRGMLPARGVVLGLLRSSSSREPPSMGMHQLAGKRTRATSSESPWATVMVGKNALLLVDLRSIS